jgi:hypothetical protein
MSETELVGLSLLLATIVGLIVWGMVKHARKDKERNMFLANAGFTACEEEKKALAKKISLLENNSEYTYSVRAPMKLRQGGIDVYFYTKDRRRHGDLYVAYEFLFTANRKANVPFQVYLKPSSIKEGVATKLMQASVTKNWDSQSDDLVKIELPMELKKGNILGLMAQRDCRLYDLFSSTTISLLGLAGDNGIFIIRCRGDLCSIENPLVGEGWNYEKVWSVILTFIRQGL